LRDGSGNFATNMITIDGTVTNPTDVATKAYVDTSFGSGTSVNTPNTLVLRDGTGSFAAQVVSAVDTVASGNLVLSTNPSTSTAGNIMKGANRFIHNIGTSNTFLGINAGNFTMTGSGENVGVGFSTLSSNITGAFNTAVGVQSLLSNTTGTGNTAIGNGSLFSNTTGFENVAVGLDALRSNTTGPSNIAVGHDAMRSNVTGSFNVAVGQNALFNNVSGFFNTALGYHAMVNNLVSENVAVGSQAMANNITGINNAALGANALNVNTTGSNNTAIGYFALPGSNSDNNTAVGANSLISCITGADNSALGATVGALLETGNNNVLIGSNAFASNVTGDDNIAIGTNAFPSAVGSRNIGIGSSVGSSLVGGDDNIYIANVGAVESSAIRIGTSGTHSTCFIQGIFGVTAGTSGVLIDASGQLGTVVSSARFKNNIADLGEQSHDIFKLRPVTFTYNADNTHTNQYGLIAEEVNTVFPALVINDQDGNPYSVQYHVLPILLLNEVQRQESTIAVLQEQMLQCFERIANLEAKVY